MISVESFDPLCRRADFLESPRSKEACRRLGFEERELLIWPPEAVSKAGVPEQFRDDEGYFLEVKAEFLEQKRVEKVTMVRKMRERMIEEKLERDLGGGGGERTGEFEEENRRFVEKEKKRIEKMVERKVSFLSGRVCDRAH